MSYLYNYSCLFPPPYYMFLGNTSSNMRQWGNYPIYWRLTLTLRREKEANSITSPQLLSIRDSAIFTTERGGGDRNPQRDIPTPRWYTASGSSWGRAAKQLQSDSNSSAWLAEVHREYAVMISVNLFVFVFLTITTIYLCISPMRRGSWCWDDKRRFLFLPSPAVLRMGAMVIQY